MNKTKKILATFLITTILLHLSIYFSDASASATSPETVSVTSSAAGDTPHTMYALLYAGTATTHKWCITVHGYQGYAESIASASKKYASEYGYNVLAPYMRFCGSTYQSGTGGWLERLDLVDWINYIISKDNQAEIIVHGFSMGAATATMLSGETLPSNVKAIIEDSGYTTYEQEIFDTSGALGVAQAKQEIIDAGYNFTLSDISAIKQVAKTKLPILVLHGKSDGTVKYTMGQDLYDAATNSIYRDILLEEGYSHIQAYTSSTSYWPKVANFLSTVNTSNNSEKTVQSISVKTAPTKTNYIQNYETLDVTGGKIQINYTDSTSEEKSMTTSMIAGFDNSKLGTQSLTVNYGGKTTSFSVSIIAKSLQSISMNTTPAKTSYIESFEALDVTGGKITLTYNDKSTSVMDITSSMITGFDNTKTGTQTLTVTYLGKTTTYQVTVVGKSLSSIAMSTLPTKLTYIQGTETLDVTGGKILLTYNNSTTEIKDITNSMVTGFDNSKTGSQTLTVSFSGKTTSFNVSITAKTLQSISINTNPSKISYIESFEKLDVTGGKITLTYSDKSTSVVDITSSMVTGFDNTKTGAQTLTVTYLGKTTTYQITIVGKTLSSIAISSLPTKLTYIQGTEALDVTGGKMLLTYNNNTSEIKDITNSMVSGFDNSKTGSQTLTVSFSGKTTTFNVSIISKTLQSIAMNTKPTKTSYIESFEKLDVTGGKITLTYSDKSTSVIDITSSMVTGFDNSKVGSQTLTVTYLGKTTTYQITIVEKTLSNITISALPTKLIYLQGSEDLDVTGGKILLTYNNNSSEIKNITSSMVTGFNNNTIGSQTLTVTYLNQTTTYDITVSKNVITVSKIEMKALPSKTTYIQNSENLNLDGGKILVHYDDSTTEEKNITSSMVTGFDNSKLGKQTITVSYLGKTTSFNITVTAQKDQNTNNNTTTNGTNNNTTTNNTINNTTINANNTVNNTLTNSIQNPNSSSNIVDNTTSPSTIPQTGNNHVVEFILVIAIICSITLAIKCSKMKDIK